MEDYPEAAKVPDRDGRLPLHQACASLATVQEPAKEAMQEVVDSLLSVHPQACVAPDHCGYLPLHIACRNGLPIALLTKLLDTHPETIQLLTKKGPKDAMFMATYTGANSIGSVVS